MFEFPLYQYGLGSRLIYELTTADYSDVLKLILMLIRICYDRILRSHIIPLKKSDTSFSGDVNSPSGSLKGVVCHSFLQKKEVKLNLVEILKNFITSR